MGGATYVAFMGYNPLFVSFFGTALPTVFSTSVPNPQLFNDFYARHLA
jgi:hypothetical protein